MTNPPPIRPRHRAARRGGLARIAFMLGLLSLLACREPSPELVDGPSLSAFEPGARFWQQTCEVELGSDLAEPSLIDGWSGPEPDGAWRWATGLRSELWLDALGGEPLRLGFEAWAYRRAADELPQRMTITVGDRQIAELELSTEPAEYSIELPGDVLVAGRNRVAFSYAASSPAPGSDPRRLSAAWRRIWTRAPGADAAASAAASAAAEAGAEAGADADGERACAQAASRSGRFDGDALHLPLDSGVELFVDSAEPGWLIVESLVVESLGAADAGARPEAAGLEASEAGRLEVIVERAAARAGGAGHRVEGTIAAGDRGFRLALPPGEGPLRIALVSRRSHEQAGAPRHTAAGAELVVGGARLARAPDRAGRPRESPGSRPARSDGRPDAEPRERPNVLVYLVDTLRADHLGCYGYPLPTSPRLDAFAREGILFERAVAQSSWTRPTVATVLTGLDPRVHGVHGRSDRLPDAIVTLPERLQAIGYDTAAVITNGNVAAAFGFQQGFDRFSYLPERPRRGRHRLSHRVTEIAGAWLEERIERGEQRPFFLYLHTTDPHAPYAPLPVYRARFLKGRETAPRLGSLGHLRALEQGAAEAESDTIADLTALYDAEIAFNDHSFGALLDRLEALGLARDTLVVFLADHGEELGEHGGWQHGRTLYQEQLHVPLVMRLPGGALAGSRRDELVQQTDLTPTVLEVVGAPPPAGLQGRPLVRRAADTGELVAASDHSPAFAVLDLDGNRGEAVLDRDRKLVRRTDGMGARPRRVELYDLSEDPAEQLDRAAAEPVWLGHLDALLRSRRVLWPTGAPAEQAVIDEELSQELRALGYVR